MSCQSGYIQTPKEKGVATELVFGRTPKGIITKGENNTKSENPNIRTNPKGDVCNNSDNMYLEMGMHISNRAETTYTSSVNLENEEDNVTIQSTEKEYVKSWAKVAQTKNQQE